MMYIQTVKPQKDRLVQSNPNVDSTTLHTEIAERLCEEINQLAKDSRHFEEQYQMILKYYQSLSKDIKKKRSCRLRRLSDVKPL